MALGFGQLQIHKVKSTPNPASLESIFYRCAAIHSWWQQWKAEVQYERGHARLSSLALGSGNCSISPSAGVFHCRFLIPWFKLQKQTRQSNWLQQHRYLGLGFFFPTPLNEQRNASTFKELFEGSKPLKTTSKSTTVPMGGSNLLPCPPWAWCSSQKHAVFPAVHAPGAELFLLSSFSLGFAQRWHMELHGRQQFCSAATFRTGFRSAFKNTTFLPPLFRQNAGKSGLLHQQQWCNPRARELQPTWLLQGARHHSSASNARRWLWQTEGRRWPRNCSQSGPHHSSSTLLWDGAELASPGPRGEVWNLPVRAL